MKEENVRKAVRERYGKIAQKQSCCCGGTGTSQQIGYSPKELKSIPEGADLNLGCGNPVALASLKEGETVVDLGSGGGIDCFLAAKKVGLKGKVIGVDMTVEMLEKARANSKKGGYNNVEFRLGEIENLPIANNTANVIISNCVINLSPNKQRVFDEAYRVLKPEGRLMVSDIALLKELPDKIKNNVLALSGCIAGADKKEDYLGKIEKAGFTQVQVVSENRFPEMIVNAPDMKGVTKELGLTEDEIIDVANSIVSIKVSAIKP